MAHAYLLLCGDGSYYCGSTRCLERRLDEHASGAGSAYTSCRQPVELVWSAEFSDVGAAYAMERRIHGWGRAKREALIRGDFDEVRRLARRRSRPD